MSDRAFDVAHLGLRHLGLGGLPKYADQAFSGAFAPTSPRELRTEPSSIAGQAGLGQVFKKAPAYVGSGVTSGGNVQINSTHVAVSGIWAPLGTIDSSGNFTPNDPTGQFTQFSDLQDTLSNWATNIITLSSQGAKFGGYFYFGLSDTNDGGAQTPGEPPGMSIMRLGKSGQLEMCTSPAVRVAKAPVAPYMPPTAPAAAPYAATTDNTIWYVLLGLTVLGVGGYILLE